MAHDRRAGEPGEWRRPVTEPALHPAPKSRRGGRIVAFLPHFRDRRYEKACAICRSDRVAVIENDRGFCWIHHPRRAEQLISGDTRLLILLEQEIPPRRTLERIMKLSGRATPAKKPPRPKRRPRDQAYVR